jgi:Pvc16 N-terminal domain
MSSALAIAGVSAVLRDLLNNALLDGKVANAVGESVDVRVGPPDRVGSANGKEASLLNLFLYRVTPNSGWRNADLPARDASGRQRLSNPPLALDLHYLLSAYSGSDLHGEILLGYAMQLLHETPVLTRAAIQTALKPALDLGTVLPSALLALADAGLAEQLEQNTSARRTSPSSGAPP